MDRVSSIDAKLCVYSERFKHHDARIEALEEADEVTGVTSRQQLMAKLKQARDGTEVLCKAREAEQARLQAERTEERRQRRRWALGIVAPLLAARRGLHGATCVGAHEGPGERSEVATNTATNRPAPTAAPTPSRPLPEPPDVSGVEPDSSAPWPLMGQGASSRSPGVGHRPFKLRSALPTFSTTSAQLDRTSIR